MCKNSKVLELIPCYKDYIWGGNTMAAAFNKAGAPIPLAESWELCAHRDGASTVAEGEFAGKTLSRLLKIAPQLFGTNCDGTLPCMIKLIDAAAPLSVQVHPSDSYALANEGEPGKTEMWYILGAKEGAELLFGFAEDVTREKVRAAIEDGTVLELLNHVKVQAGDLLFIPSGTVHAIGAGITLAEIQQNSNTTYRVFDYKRRGKDGKLRPLHIEKALDVANFSRLCVPQSLAPPCLMQSADAQSFALPETDYFTCLLHRIKGEIERGVTPASFVHLLCTEGAGELLFMGERRKIKKGDSLFLPAVSAAFTLSGALCVLETAVPKPRP